MTETYPFYRRGEGTARESSTEQERAQQSPDPEFGIIAQYDVTRAHSLISKPELLLWWKFHCGLAQNIIGNIAQEDVITVWSRTNVWAYSHVGRRHRIWKSGEACENILSVSGTLVSRTCWSPSRRFDTMVTIGNLITRSRVCNWENGEVQHTCSRIGCCRSRERWRSTSKTWSSWCSSSANLLTSKINVRASAVIMMSVIRKFADELEKVDTMRRDHDVRRHKTRCSWCQSSENLLPNKRIVPSSALIITCDVRKHGAHVVSHQKTCWWARESWHHVWWSWCPTSQNMVLLLSVIRKFADQQENRGNKSADHYVTTQTWCSSRQSSENLLPRKRIATPTVMIMTLDFTKQDARHQKPVCICEAWGDERWENSSWARDMMSSESWDPTLGTCWSWRSQGPTWWASLQTGWRTTFLASKRILTNIIKRIEFVALVMFNFTSMKAIMTSLHPTPENSELLKHEPIASHINPLTLMDDLTFSFYSFCWHNGSDRLGNNQDER